MIILAVAVTTARHDSRRRRHSFLSWVCDNNDFNRPYRINALSALARGRRSLCHVSVWQLRKQPRRCRTGCVLLQPAQRLFRSSRCGGSPRAAVVRVFVVAAYRDGGCLPSHGGAAARQQPAGAHAPIYPGAAPVPPARLVTPPPLITADLAAGAVVPCRAHPSGPTCDAHTRTHAATHAG